MPSRHTLLCSLLLVLAACGDDDGMDGGALDAGFEDVSVDVATGGDAAADAPSDDTAIDVCEGVPESDRCGETLCEGNTLVVCEANEAGCLVRRNVDCESAGTTCDDDSRTCGGMCEEPQCDTTGVSCDGDTLVTCTEGEMGCRREERSGCALGCEETAPEAACRLEDICMPLADAVIIGCDSEPITGSTYMGTSAFDNYCGSRRFHFGREQIYAFRDPRVARATVRVTRAFGERDMELFVLDDTSTCENTSCVVWDRSNDNAKDVTFNSYPDGTNYISYDLEADAPSEDGAVYQLSVECEFSTCGDTLIEGGEGCDDGGNVSGDGCSEYCEIEPGFYCIDGICSPEFTAGEGVLEDSDSEWTRPTRNCEAGDVDTVFDTIPYTNPTAETQYISIYSATSRPGMMYLFRTPPDSENPEVGCEDADYQFSSAYNGWLRITEVAPGETVYLVISSLDAGGRGNYSYSIYDAAAGCGDGSEDYFPYGEECDDGNRVDGDGCSSSCQSE